MQVVSSYPNNMFCWIDLNTTDAVAAKEFYGGLFGWDFIDVPTSMGVPYSLCQIGGYNVAGLSQMMPDMLEQKHPPVWTSYIKHDDADAAAAAVAAAGGRVLAPPMDVMEAGRMALIQDPAGAVVGIWQPKENTGAQLVNIPNALVWNELQTRDTASAVEFYRAAFGWGYLQDPSGYHLFKLGERIQAGMFLLDESMADIPPNWSVYFMSEEIEATTAKAKELGAVIYVSPTKIDDMGSFSVFQDPQGAMFTAMQFDGPVDAPPGY